MFNMIVQRKNGLPALSTLLAMSYLGYVVVTLIFFPAFDQARNGNQDALIPMTITAPRQEKPAPDYAQIGSWHLFGQTVDSSASAGVNPPATQLQLKLHGVLIAAGYGHYAHAIIATADQTQKTYRINDEVPGGAHLKAIEKDKIILVGTNGQEFLALEKQGLE